MQIETIDELAEVLALSSLTTLEVETDDWALTLERPARGAAAGAAPQVSLAMGDGFITTAEDARPVPLEYVEAGVVGVFHEANPPVALGQAIRAEDVLGTIDALTIRNDVRAPVDSEVAGVQVEDGQPVEFGQILFALAPRGAS